MAKDKKSDTGGKIKTLIADAVKQAVNTIGDAGAYTNLVSNIGTERDKASHGQFVRITLDCLNR